LIALAGALGRLMSAGIAVGVSLHDSAIAILRPFGKSERLHTLCEQAIRGEAVLCIGASEESGGFDLQIVETEMRSYKDGFAVQGVRSTCRWRLLPTTSWWSLAVSTTIPRAGTATSR
jgi:acyl-ACP dehydrogenase